MSTVARELPGIDRLADVPLTVPATSVLKRSVDPSVHMHAQLGVPTFIWGESAPNPSQIALQASSQATSTTTSALKSIIATEPDSPPLADPVSLARGHLKRLSPMYGLPESRVDAMPVQFSQPMKSGGAIVKFRNRIDGIEVFREEAAVMLGRDGGLVAIGGFVSGGETKGTFSVAAPDAIAIVLGDWSFDQGIYAAIRHSDARDGHDYYTVTGDPVSGDGSRVRSAVRVKNVLFRMPEGLRPAYYIEVELDDGQEPGEIDTYGYVVDANDRTVLYRRDQTANDAFGYRVFAESDGINLPFPSPAGRDGWPHPTGTPNGYQPTLNPVASNLISLQNAPFTKNDPWLAAGAGVTRGNNVDAFANLVAPDGYNDGDLRTTTSSAGTFDYAHDPLKQPGDNTIQKSAAVVSLFYLNNFMHDWYYDAGFDEAAGNAQSSNFGRGGLGNDAIVAQAQDYSGRNNANMSTPSDGSRPRMRMYIFTAAQALTVTVNTPASVAGNKTPVAGAQFGPTSFNRSGSVALSSPADGCTGAGAGVAGKIALIDRGSCTFKTKVVNAQNAGATAVVIVNNVTGAPIAMGDDATVPTVVTIPSVMLTQADGNALKGQLPSPGVTLTMSSTAGADRDGTIDNTIVAHEWGHYISNRLVVNANGLNTNMADGMGEGWADFHALLLLVKGSDALLPANANFNGLYTIGAYSIGGNNAANESYYYGIRRYPYSRDITKNPLMFRHVQNGVALPSNPAARFGGTGASNAEVHNTGEVWASMLWECYGNLLNDTPRLTFDQAQDRMKRYLIAGYKMTPASPTFLEARDALLSAMAAQDSKDYAACLAGFAKRGAGAGAVSPDRYSTTNLGVVESTIANGALAIVGATMTDTQTSCDVDGYVDNGETGTLSLTIRNTGATMLSSITAALSSSNPHVAFPNGPNVSIPAIAPGQQTTIAVPVHVAGATTFETATITISADDPTLQIARPVLQSVTVIINADEKANQSKTDTVETAHTAWTTGNSTGVNAVDSNWRRIAVSGTDHRWLGPDVATPQLTWLQSPPISVTGTGNFSFTFRHRFSFETDASGDYDGGQIQISVDNGATWSDIGGSASPGYNGTFATYDGNDNPLQGQNGYVKQNAAWPSLETVTVNLGAAHAGQTVRVRFVIATDTGTSGPGWEIDDIAFNNISNTPFDAIVAHANACNVVTIVSGSAQNAQPGTTFSAPLKAVVKTTGGTPVAGAQVTFTAPATGASATFAGSATVTTDANGVATSPALTANPVGGAYLVKATAGGQSAAFSLANAASLPIVNIDVDGDGRYDALSDGLLIVRYLFGITGNTLTAGATSANAARTSAAAITQYLDSIRSTLDIDGNGQVDALTDGLLIIRYLFGIRGAALINSVLSPNATRTSSAQIEAQVQALLP